MKHLTVVTYRQDLNQSCTSPSLVDSSITIACFHPDALPTASGLEKVVDAVKYQSLCIDLPSYFSLSRFAENRLAINPNPTPSSSEPYIENTHSMVVAPSL